MTISYIPLRLYSEYSIESSIIRINDAVKFAKDENFPALNLSDNMNMFAAVKFYNICRKNGIKPIFSVDFSLENIDDNSQPHRVLLLAKNYVGYLSLCELLTHAYMERDKKLDTPMIRWQWLEEIDKTNLICLSGAQQGVVGYYLLKNKSEKAKEYAQKLADWFQDNFYLEIQRYFDVSLAGDVSIRSRMDELKKEAEINLSGSLLLAQELNLPLVATHPIQFMQQEDFVAHEAKVCIASGYVLEDERRVRKFHPSQYFLGKYEMNQLFKDLPSALQNSYEIAKRCTVSLTLNKSFLPIFPTPHNESLEDYLIKVSKLGLQERLTFLFPDEEERVRVFPIYQERLDSELDIIIQMGFSGYFLIVADFINWAKNNGCPVGPGRGSGAGSLVAYSLKITDLDPIKYNLLFERFLNPERVSMPDFDIDFCQDNRNRVIDYVRSKYGEMAVSQIVTFGTMSSRAVIRDVGRVLGIPFGVCDRLSKLIPIETNRPVSLQRAMELEPDIQRLIHAEEAEELMRLALKLEDLVRNTGMHAGGVLIAPNKLTDFCPIYKPSGTDSATISMYDKEDVEAVGLVKFDFLGLRNLTILQMAQDLIKKNRDKEVDISKIPLDDVLAFKIFQNANTTAVFQFESNGMKRMLFEAKPSKFEEIIAFVALYRPGPMDLIPDFIQRMHGAKFEYLHPFLQEILEPTYGIMVYQEQVMQAAQICAGYSLGSADLLRRAMGKKKVEEMLKQREIFVLGAKEKGIDTVKSNEIFDYMERFAGYGFNKSHAAAYALIAYQTAWLKAHYAVEFMSATMSSELHNTDQLEIFYEDAKKNNIKFLPPDINESFYCFIPQGTDSIRYALGAIKGVGEAAVEALILEREKHGSYQDLFDFCGRLSKNVINKRTLESLIKAGTFDSLESNRALLFENIGFALSYADQKGENQFQGGLFDLDEEVKTAANMQETIPWKLSRRLAEEKEAIGFYISAHPFEPYKVDLQHLPRVHLSELKPSDRNIWIAGFVTKMRSLITKSGRKIWILEIDDMSARQEIILNEEVMRSCSVSIHPDMPIFCSCRVRTDEYSKSKELKITVNKVVTIDDMIVSYASGLQLCLNPHSPVLELFKLLERYKSHSSALKVSIMYQDEFIESSLIISDEWQVKPEQALMEQLENMLGSSNVKIQWYQ
ncbi:MAG: DNA polymerase III subunit alpha [Neisseriaceae bacterium]|nr:MAG: DNA polymerase III subunit alpha [Neisseriaceae bacterium]